MLHMLFSKSKTKYLQMVCDFAQLLVVNLNILLDSLEFVLKLVFEERCQQGLFILAFVGEGVGIRQELVGCSQKGGVLDRGSELQGSSLDFFFVGTFPSDLEESFHSLIDDLLQRVHVGDYI